MDNNKLAGKYAKMFCRSMKKSGMENPLFYERYKSKYLEYVNSPKYAEFVKYKTMGTDKVYAAVTHAKVCEEFGISLDEAQHIWEKYTAKNVRKIIKGFCRAIDILPNGYKIVSGWLYKDAQERIAENCLTYEMLVYSSQKLEYKITHCMYVEVFERYGIKSFCKVFCDNDLCMSVMHRKAKFIRHSDLVDGHCCHDEVINLEERK